jgi:hypothetical protein
MMLLIPGHGCGETMTSDQRSNAVRHAPTTGGGLSIVVPVFNEAAGLAALHARLAEVAAALGSERGLACEIVYVDDGSRDA